MGFGTATMSTLKLRVKDEPLCASGPAPMQLLA